LEKSYEMKCIFGSVVGRKFEKVSHKIAKVRCTKKEEHIVLKNMHEPIIDIETWNKAQDKLNNYTKVRERKYDHILKGLVYCGECGNKATLRCREQKRKDGSMWRNMYFICSKRNNYSGLCDCKQISANLIEEEVKQQLKKELERIYLNEKEINQIYVEAKLQVMPEEITLKTRLKNLKEKLNKIDQDIEELYNDKINRIIEVADFKAIYERMQTKKYKILKGIKETQIAITQNNDERYQIDFKEMKRVANELLKLETFNKIILERLIKKVEFDKQKNIKITLTFKE